LVLSAGEPLVADLVGNFEQNFANMLG